MAGAKPKRGLRILPIALQFPQLPIPIEVRPHVGTALAGRYCESNLSCSSRANLLASCSATACSTRSGRNRRPNNRSESPKNPHYFDSYHRRTPRRQYRFCRPGFCRSLPRQGVTPSVAAWRFEKNAALVVEGVPPLGIVGVFPNKTLVPAAYYGLAAKCPESLNR